MLALIPAGKPLTRQVNGNAPASVGEASICNAADPPAGTDNRAAGIGVGEGREVLVAVGARVDVCVAVGVGVSDAVGAEVGAKVGVNDTVGVGVFVNVSVCVNVNVNVDVNGSVDVAGIVDVAAVGTGVGEAGVWHAARTTSATARPMKARRE